VLPEWGVFETRIGISGNFSKWIIEKDFHLTVDNDLSQCGHRAGALNFQLTSFTIFQIWLTLTS
jgi:hypothetical protein